MVVNAITAIRMKELPPIRKQTVKVYRNRGYKFPYYSIAHKSKVIGHAKTVIIYHARFHVNESGRQRVLLEQRKNVHAWVVGQLVYASLGDAPDLEECDKVTYDPLKAGYFYHSETREKVHSADQLLLTNTGMYGTRVK